MVPLVNDTIIQLVKQHLIAPPKIRPNGASIWAAKSFAEVETLRTAWQELNRHPATDIDAYRLLFKHRPHLQNPYVMALTQDDKVSAILVGRIENSHLEVRLGYMPVWKPKVKAIVVPDGGLLGDFTLPNARLACLHLLESLRQRDADVVIFEGLKLESDMYRVARSLPGLMQRSHGPRPQRHWKMRLPSSYEEFLKRLNKKHRYWLRRLDKVVEKEFPGQVSIRSFADDWPVDSLLRDLESVACKTYQRALGAGFRNDVEHSGRFALAASKKLLRAYVLYLGKRPCAFWLGTICKGVFHSGATGYDAEFRKYELGTLVFMKMLEDLCLEGVSGIDFGPGDALYKQRFGDESWDEVTAHVFSTRTRGLIVNVGVSATQTIDKHAAGALARLSVLQRLKTKWRQRLSQRLIDSSDQV